MAKIRLTDPFAVEQLARVLWDAIGGHNTEPGFTAMLQARAVLREVEIPREERTVENNSVDVHVRDADGKIVRTYEVRRASK